MKLINFVFSIGLSIIMMIISGYMISKYWSWFIVSHFASLPKIDIFTAIGIRLTYYVFTVTDLAEIKYISAMVENINKKINVEEQSKEYSDIGRKLLFIFIVYPIALLIGYVWHRFV